MDLFYVFALVLNFHRCPLTIHDGVTAELLEKNKDCAADVEFVKQISRPGYETLDELPINERRFIKTHFPFSLMPPSVFENKCKVWDFPEILLAKS